MNTKFARKEDFYNGTTPRVWWIVDAEGQTLGRMATRIAHVRLDIFFSTLSRENFLIRSKPGNFGPKPSNNFLLL